MPIDVKCSGCSQRMRVPDRVAGKRVKCPKCGSPISVPAEPVTKELEAVSALPLSAKKIWYVRTDDQQEFGPLGKDELDQWAVEGRLNVDSQILQKNAKQWQWAIVLYPELDVEGIYVGGEEELPAEEAQPEQAQAEQDSQAVAETLDMKTDGLFGSDETANNAPPDQAGDTDGDSAADATEDDLFGSESSSNDELAPLEEDDLFSTDGSADLGDLDDLSGFDDLSDLDEPK